MQDYRNVKIKLEDLRNQNINNFADILTDDQKTKFRKILKEKNNDLKKNFYTENLTKLKEFDEKLREENQEEIFSAPHEVRDISPDKNIEAVDMKTK
jgi:ketol-acid reductoisomerase